jgi:hypothetical protein
MVEGTEHKRIRERIIKFLKHNKYKCFSGHIDSDQDLGLFKDKKGADTHFSDADILILNNDDKIISIIEIKDEDIQPKQIIGIIGATSICNKFIDKNGNEFKFDHPSLYIVIRDELLNKPGSKKKQQMRLIKENLSIQLGAISIYEICSENEIEGLLSKKELLIK